MNFEVKIENFGPIQKARIQVGRFTVFAGPNNTGKTFVSKMLYSILSAINANHVQVFFGMMTDIIESDLRHYERTGLAVEERHLLEIRKALEKIDSVLRETFPSHPVKKESDWLREIQPELKTEIEKIESHFQILRNNVKTKRQFPVFEASSDLLRSLLGEVDSVVGIGERFKFIQNVQGNFQTSDLSELKGGADFSLRFSVEGVGELREEENRLNFTFSRQIAQSLQPFSEAFYLESPIYWKLKSALESIKLDSRSFFRTLNGVPDYFYDMVVALRRERTEHPLHPFAGIYENLNTAINGRISLNEAGNLEFQQNKKPISLSLTSGGVANMGILALLVERGALDRGSFLFIDEPESNLHPAWQVEMAKFLFELARQGINVVVSTHSMTFLKWIEVQVKGKPEDRELVKLNKFPPDAQWNHDMDAVMTEVKQSLTKPFSDLYIEGL